MPYRYPLAAHTLAGTNLLQFVLASRGVTRLHMLALLGVWLILKPPLPPWTPPQSLPDSLTSLLPPAFLPKWSVLSQNYHSL